MEIGTVQVSILLKQDSHWLLVTGIKVFSRIFKVNNVIFQGHILRNSIIYIPLRKSGPLIKLWKGHIKFEKSWLHIKLKDFSRTFKSILTKFKDFQGHENEPIFFKYFQGFSTMWQPCQGCHPAWNSGSTKDSNLQSSDYKSKTLNTERYKTPHSTLHQEAICWMLCEHKILWKMNMNQYLFERRG